MSALSVGPAPRAPRRPARDTARAWGCWRTAPGTDASPGSWAGTVAGDQHRDLFVRQPLIGRLTAPLARLARQVVAFERFEKVGLVRFHDAMQMRWLGPGQCGQKPVPPTEGG